MIVYVAAVMLTKRSHAPAVLEWISIYYFSRAGPAASVRIYYEMSNGGEEVGRSPGWTSVPLGVSYFPAEIMHLPKLYVLCCLGLGTTFSL